VLDRLRRVIVESLVGAICARLVTGARRLCIPRVSYLPVTNWIVRSEMLRTRR